MKRIICIALCLLSISKLPAQDAMADSLIRVALSMQNKESNKGLVNGDSIFNKLSRKMPVQERFNLVYEAINNGNDVSQEGLALYYKILDWAKKNNDPIIEAAITAELGYNLNMNGNNEEGSRLAFTALELAKETGNNRAIGIAYENLAVILQDKPALSLDYLYKSLDYSIKGNDDLYVMWELMNIGRTYRVLNKLDSARFYALRAFTWVVDKGLSASMPMQLMSLEKLEKNERTKINYVRASMQMALRYSYGLDLMVAYGFFGSYYLKAGNIDSAYYYASNQYTVAQNYSLFRQLEPTDLLASIFMNKNSDSALKYTLLFHFIKDSLNNNKNIEREQAQLLLNQRREQQLETERNALQTNRRFLILMVVMAFLLLLALIYWRNNRKNKAANTILQQQKEKIQTTLQDLEATQSQLIQSEKMASLGELTAGIAHEIQNPLNFVNNFSEVNKELLEELKEEADKGNINEVKVIVDDLIGNSEKINHHGKRADAIVKGMLQHSRSTNNATKEPTDINALADEYLRLAYHGLRAKDKSFNATLKTDFDNSVGKINIIPQDLGRVILNLINNAFYIVDEKKKSGIKNYEPTVSVSTKKVEDKIEIKVADNGNGIPQKVLDKIFQPFFTTKPTGQGTGLGLSLSYDIVKAHGGELRVETKENTGTTFSILLSTKA